MLPFLIILIVLGAVLEIISLRRDPALIEMDYNISTNLTEPGKPFVIQSTITNNSRVPVSYLAVRELIPECTEIPDGVTTHVVKDGLLVKNIYRLSGLRRKKLLLELSVSKRGVHMFSGESVEFGDFLGFRVITKKVRQQRELVVYPEPNEDPELSQILSSFCGDMTARRYLLRDPILTAGTREYTGREPMRDIHWLQSARRGDLMVREFEYNRQPSTCVILDVNGVGSSEDDLDSLCSVTRSVCQALVNKGSAVSFYTNSRLKRRERREVWKCEASPLYMTALLEGLGRATSVAVASTDSLMQRAIRDSDPDAAFIIVSSANNADSAQLFEGQRHNTGREFLMING